jgi:hypothetical protein
VSPYRNPRTLLALLLIVGAGVGLIVIVNQTASGGVRTVGTIAAAVALWLALMVVLREARRVG